MKLTGKAKEKFDKWMIPNPLEHGRYGQLISNTFEDLPIEMQFGVYQLFGDSLEINIETKRSVFSEVFQHYYQVDGDRCTPRGETNQFKTRPEAMRAAVEKLNQIINEND